MAIMCAFVSNNDATYNYDVVHFNRFLVAEFVPAD